ncbi:MAG: glycosyltransferase involved in cell wall biosynthesis [Myxococcota bacterium]|jgi:glycosyltransferase involved in cell wall biosynthesis
MKILHFHDSPHVHGGATQYLNQVLQALNAAGHENHLFSIGPRVDINNIVSQHTFEYQWPKSVLQRRRDFYKTHAPLADKLAATIESVRPDLIHVHNCTHFRKTVFNTILYKGVKSVMTVHDFSLDWKSSPQRKLSGAKALLSNALNKPQHQISRLAVLDAMDLFLCPTHALMNGLGLPPNKSVCHRLPIQPADASEIPLDKLRMFFAGTLFDSKGVDVLIDALASAKHLLGDFALEIAGSGDRHQDLVDQVAGNALQNNIKFLGQLDQQQMDSAYQRANLQVLPSRVPENSPLTVLEAGARGRPAIASHAGGVPELITPERGWTFPSEDSSNLANSLVGIANDLPSLNIKGQNMRKWVRAEFDPTEHWQQLAQYYTHLIS